MILIKFIIKMSLTILRDMASCLEDVEDEDRSDESSLHQKWEKHILLDTTQGLNSEIPRGGYLHGNRFIRHDIYKTQDSKACFGFRFHSHSDCWNAEVVSVPFSHVFPDVEGSLILSGSNPPHVKTYSQAKNLAKVWAEFAWNHIKKECPFCIGNV